MLCVIGQRFSILIGIQSGRQVGRGFLVPVVSTGRHFFCTVVVSASLLPCGSITSHTHTRYTLGCTLNVSHTSVHPLPTFSGFFSQSSSASRKKAVLGHTHISKKPQLEQQRCQQQLLLTGHSELTALGRARKLPYY